MLSCATQRHQAAISDVDLEKEDLSQNSDSNSVSDCRSDISSDEYSDEESRHIAMKQRNYVRSSVEMDANNGSSGSENQEDS